ncbi:MAG TPA: helix-turn-helix domain-containing protein [Alphaproteobacteria bacterium]|nr:helix-turn-helix domain-containing protein [Alphaproteobacteria bacterium]
MHIATLRGALSRSGMPALIRTVRSRGYSLDPER